MKIIIGLTFAVVIGSCVSGNLLSMFGKIQDTLGSVGL
jgi:hypothetical protein